MTVEPFERLIDAAKAGADWAWARIYDDLAPAMLGYMRARGAQDPEAVVGEVFVQLVRDIKRFEGDEAGFRSWVFVMAHHRLLDDFRKRSRRPESLTANEDLHPVVDETDTGDVEGSVIDSIRASELRRSLDRLTPDQRDVVLLRVFGGLKFVEIAEAVGKRTGAVKALHRRGIEALKQMAVESGMYPSADPRR